MNSIINGVISKSVNIDDWKQKGNAYEVLRVINDKPLFLKEHLLRLKSAVGNTDILAIENELKMLINSYEGELNNNIFISVNTKTNDTGIFIIKGFYPPKEWYENGIKINTYQIKRADPSKKIYDINYKKKIEEHLKKTDVFETLITDSFVINEGSRSNVFFIKGDVVYTPSVEAVLPGITRDKVFLSAKNCGISIIETIINACDLKIYDGAFITGTSIDLLPIRQIDDIEYKTTDLNCFKKLSTNFENIKNKDLEVTNVK